MGSVFVVHKINVLRIEENDELFKTWFLRSFIRGSRVSNPARFKEPLYSGSASNKARAIP